VRPLEEAQAEVLSAVRRLDAEQVTIWEARGRVLAEGVVAPESVPPFDNSAMDGFAVRGADVSSPGAVLEVIGDLPAGSTTTTEVGPRQAMRIMTGAPMPPGADTIVKVEDTEEADGSVHVRPAVVEGTSVRLAGGDISQGQPVFPAGTRLTSMHVGVLATIGVGNPVVHRRPRVAYMSTGDELAPVDSGRLAPGMIRDSNRPMLKSLLDDTGVDVVDLGVIPDDEGALRQALSEGSSCDAVVTTGGVSMGDYDVTKLVLSGEASVGFWTIAIQPAKPFAFGHVDGAMFFGLPGNPVSVLVSYEQLMRPALLAMQGARAIFRPRMQAVTDEALDTDPAKTVFLRVRFTDEGDDRVHVALSGGQSSNVLSAAAAADAFAVIPRGTGRVDAGQNVTIELFKAPESREHANGG
jgi:molybdopterin molybdotransferase